MSKLSTDDGLKLQVATTSSENSGDLSGQLGYSLSKEAELMNMEES